MKKSIGFCEFCDTFRDMNRDDNFSYDGKQALYDYLEELESDIGEEVELDVIALCCEYTEYTDVQEFIDNYGDKYSPDKPEEPTKPLKSDFSDNEKYQEAIEEYQEELETYQEELEEYNEELTEKTLDELRDYTQVIDIDGTSFIIQDF